MGFKALEDTKAELRAIFDSAGPEMKLSGVDIPGCTTLAEKNAHVKKLGDRLEELENIARIAGSGGYGESDPQRGTYGGSDPVKRHLEAMVKSKELPEHAAERVERLLKTDNHAERDLTGRWLLAAGSPAYKSAFAKLLADPERGHLDWTNEEREAHQKAKTVNRELKSLNTGNTGSYIIPVTLDPAVLLNTDGSFNPLRQLARVEQTATGQWTGITSAGVTAEWLAEEAEAAEVSPVLANPNIDIHKLSVYAEYSYEWELDSLDGARQLQEVMVDAADQETAAKYTVGSGVGQPKGIVTALAGTASEINSSGTEALSSADPYTLQNALGPRFQPRAQWAANLSIINTLRQMETASGALKFPELRNTPPSLIGRGIHEVSNMDGSINAAATASNFVLLYGAFNNFVIVDGIGSSVDFIPVVVGANRRPVGKRGIHLWFRTGSDVVIPNAFRMLDVPTTA